MKKQSARILTVFLFCLAAAFAAGCRKPVPVSSTVHEEPVYLSVGESARLELSNIPEGKTAENYTWSMYGGMQDSLELRSGTVTALRTYPSPLWGTMTVEAELKHSGTVYRERFTVVIEKDVEQILFKYPSLTLLTGDHLSFGYVTTVPETLSNGQRIEYTADPGIIEAESAKITALESGEAVFTVRTGGCEASCPVRVFDPPGTAQEKLAYLSSWQDSYAEPGQIIPPKEHKQRMENPGVSVPVSELPPELGSAPEGKYMVVWDYPDCSPNSLVYSEENVRWPDQAEEAFCGYTAALPEELRPERWEQVEYVIRVCRAEPKQWCMYEEGVRGIMLPSEIRLETVGGELIEILDTVQGKVPDKVGIPKNGPAPYAVLLGPASVSRTESALSEVLKQLGEPAESRSE